MLLIRFWKILVLKEVVPREVVVHVHVVVLVVVTVVVVTVAVTRRKLVSIRRKPRSDD